MLDEGQTERGHFCIFIILDTDCVTIRDPYLDTPSKGTNIGCCIAKLNAGSFIT